MDSNLSRRAVGLLLLVYLSFAWGSNWPAIKIAVSEIPIWQYRAATGLGAGVLLFLYAWARGNPMRVPRRQWAPLAVVTLTNVTLWLTLVGFGVKLMESGQASLIGFTMPVWASIMAAMFLGERLTWRRVVSLLLGIGGIFVLLGPSLGSFGDRPLGILLVLAAAIFFAAGTIVVKRVDWAVPPASFAGWQMVIGSIPIVVIAAFTETFTMHQASAPALWACAYTMVMGLVFAYIAWFRIVEIFPASIAAIGTLAVPAIGLLAGAIVLGEPLGVREISALVMVLSAVALVLFEPQRAPRPAA